MNKFWLFTLLSVIAILLSSSVNAQIRSKTAPRRPSAPAPKPIAQNYLAEDEQPDGDADASAVKGLSASNEVGAAAGTGFAKGAPQDEYGSSGSSGSGFVKNEEEAGANEAHPAPEPYSFSYSADTEDGASSTREETGDKDGTITGFYMVNQADGRQRRVNYIADKNGFRATITTNEVGTESKNPADVILDSSAPEVDFSNAPGGSGEAPVAGNSGASGGLPSSGSSFGGSGNVKNSGVEEDNGINYGSDASSRSGQFVGFSKTNPARRPAPSVPRPQPASQSYEDTSSASEESDEDSGTTTGTSEISSGDEEIVEKRPQAPVAPQPIKGRPAQRPAPRPIQRPIPRPVSAPRPQQPIAPQPRPVPQPIARPQQPQPVKGIRPQQPVKGIRPQQPSPTKRPVDAPRPAPRPQQPIPQQPRPLPQPIARPQQPVKGIRPQQPVKGIRPQQPVINSSAKRPVVAPRPAPRPQQPLPQRPVAQRPRPIPQRPVAPVQPYQEGGPDEDQTVQTSTSQRQNVYASPLSAAPSRSKFVVIPLGNRRPDLNMLNSARFGPQSGVVLSDDQIRSLLSLSTRIQ